jgi:hypothetical protein
VKLGGSAGTAAAKTKEGFHTCPSRWQGQQDEHGERDREHDEDRGRERHEADAPDRGLGITVAAEQPAEQPAGGSGEKS